MYKPSGTSKPERSKGLMLGIGGEPSDLVELFPVKIRSIPAIIKTIFCNSLTYLHKHIQKDNNYY